ncbi:MAG: AAA family ATPase, partial [Phycisphaerae bacterium]|nr:AAA family ATPase [Phycisphaerae bacterium]
MAGMRVIAVTGSNGSGKDVLAEHLARRCDTPVFSLGDAVREIAEEEGVDRTRENL